MSCCTECNTNNQTNGNSWKPFLGKIAGWLSKAGVYAVIGACFTTALSTSMMGAFGLLIILFWILSGRITDLPWLVRKNPPAAWAMALGCLFIIGLSYSPATLDDSLDMLKKYRELLFIPAVMALMSDCSTTVRRRAVYAFFLGAALSLVASYLMFFGLMKAPHV
ncbi:MAG: hypothetical protein OEV64_07240, partial [Desulfobulbaceae bacterium]|nr:hypothetical protein [Desulfobulbaceae bacterium]